MIANYFKFQDRGTNLKTEILAGCTTFMTMAYIIFVNPQILNFFGDPKLQSIALPFGPTMSVTCLTAGILCIAMGLFTNYPITMAAGMGLNAMVAYQFVLGSKLSFPAAMGIVVIEGLIITILVMTGFRKAVMDAIPLELKKAIGAGIGLFIAFIGFQEAGFMQHSDATLVTLGNFTSWPVFIAVIGLILSITLMALRVKSALFFGILGTTVVAVIINALTGYQAFTTPGVAVIPRAIFCTPDFSLVGKFDFTAFHLLGIMTTAILIFSIMLSDFFDTMGTVIAVGDKAKLLDKQGNLPGVNRVLLVDSIGAMFGGMCSSSTNTCYIEAASGVTQGGRTGMMPIVTGILFLLAIFFNPIAGIVPKEATAPALIIVGFLMLSVITEIDFSDFHNAFPAFLVLLVMPFTYSISNGIGFGFIAYTVLHLLTGEYKKIHWLMYLISLAFLLDFLIPLIKLYYAIN